ncbi:hypothetical protein, partial [Candidatus Bandiella numerosa]|uniref:hypothetical protein n=1 Tax=Candidatus Bandiella numerosa TaxID=2570586 RepID=UPI001F1F3691
MITDEGSCLLTPITIPSAIENRVERRIAAPPSHTTVQAMSHRAVSDLCLPKAEYIEKRLIFS